MWKEMQVSCSRKTIQTPKTEEGKSVLDSLKGQGRSGVRTDMEKCSTGTLLGGGERKAVGIWRRNTRGAKKTSENKGAEGRSNGRSATRIKEKKMPFSCRNVE